MTQVEIETKMPEKISRNKGMKRGIIQIEKTISFELKRNSRKLLSMIITAVVIYGLSLAIIIVTQNLGGELPENVKDYITSNYFSMFFGMLTYIIASAFAGNIIAEDFEKDTGNLIFPKITRIRLLIGRFIARYLYAALSIMVYYLLVGVTTYIEYQAIPKEFWLSMVWALLYLFTIMTFVTFMSSFMKRSATAIVLSILALLIVFNMVSTILSFSGVDTEPLFLLTYYENIITACFNMPATDARMMPQSFGPPGQSGSTYYIWSTPSVLGAILGMIIYSTILLTAAYLIYQRRQKK